MLEIPTVGSKMTEYPYSVSLDETLRVAQDMMQEYKIRHLPVLDKGKPVSVLSDRDVKQAFIAFNQGDIDQVLVKDAATLSTYIVDIKEPLDSVAMHMADNHIGSALVTDGGRLAGIFTTTDACRCLAEALRGQS